MGLRFYDVLSGVGTRVKKLQADVCIASISVSLDLSVFSYIERNEAA